jgi:hypothetical protein
VHRHHETTRRRKEEKEEGEGEREDRPDKQYLETVTWERYPEEKKLFGLSSFLLGIFQSCATCALSSYGTSALGSLNLQTLPALHQLGSL